jgi:hypothetical protein
MVTFELLTSMNVEWYQISVNEETERLNHMKTKNWLASLLHKKKHAELNSVIPARSQGPVDFTLQNFHKHTRCRAIPLLRDTSWLTIQFVYLRSAIMENSQENGITAHFSGDRIASRGTSLRSGSLSTAAAFSQTPSARRPPVRRRSTDAAGQKTRAHPA